MKLRENSDSVNNTPPSQNSSLVVKMIAPREFWHKEGQFGNETLRCVGQPDLSEILSISTSTIGVTQDKAAFIPQYCSNGKPRFDSQHVVSQNPQDYQHDKGDSHSWPF